ncbi:hypothetical protein [Nitratireductor sp. ZSWI3]|uniref:cell division protein FtsL n=1 Tax=Nitratireductor sp. ZSWI3 TaxID=2966359 RepID=UPI00214F88CB|nr:hypothetical protein [Nitratireductor sp. ZSWI3]MCR4266056.1 hypothetical protein [Nitratireductor sp. ZSWI3]
MFRTSDIVLITVMMAAAAFTYKTKHEAEAKYEELRRIETQTRLEADSIDLLKADWSLLTQPARLQRLAETYQDELGLKPVGAPQIAEFSDLPIRPLTIEGIVTDMASADGAPDRTTTGAVRP